MGESSNYNREEDRAWRAQTDTRLTLLTQGEIVQNDRMDALQERIDGLDTLISGDTDDKEDSGLKGDILDLAREMNALHRILAPDALGHGGFINRLRAVEEKLGLGERASENRWKFATVVVGATVTAIATITVALLAIDPVRKSVGEYLASHFGQTEKQRAIASQKRSGKPRVKRIVIRESAPPTLPALGTKEGEALNDDAAKEDVSE